MKKYDNYKDSGIEWIGTYPKDWTLMTVRRITDDHKQGYYSSEEYKNEGYRLIRITDLDANGNIDISKSPYVNPNDKEIQIFEIKKGDMLFPRTGSIGLIGVAKNDMKAVFASYLIRFRFKENTFNSFMRYYFMSDVFLNGLFSDLHGGVNQNIHAENIKDQYIVLPSKDEQVDIAKFLDDKTNQLDILISKKEQFISLLQEERTAIINQSVTKGLDPKVKMKDSGIVWLGEIPENWEVKKLKYIKSNIKNAFVDGPFGSNLKTEHFVENGDVYVIDSGLITSGVFHKKREMKTITNDHFETVLRSECKQNDIIIAKIGANFGMSGILPKLDKPSLVSGNTLKLTVNEEMYDLKLIHLQLLNLKTSGEIDLLVKGSAQPALSMGVMSELPFVIPSTLEEQVIVRDYILKQHLRIDKLISKSQQEIELLKEYKTALINEVVTGKIDVRNELIN